MQRKTITENPPNRETPLEALALDITPTGLFYVRSNFEVPSLDPTTHRVSLSGRVERPSDFSLSELKELGVTTETVTFECAGNARLSMVPVPEGTAWGWGAASTAEFAGVPLRTVLGAVGLEDDVVEVAFAGADHGVVDGEEIQFERSLPLRTALREDVLLAWEMNGEPLPVEHGAPLRLVVPGWYGVASVKWIQRIEALRTPLSAHFQTDRYVYRGEAGISDGTPVRRMRVRSLIAKPSDGAELTADTEHLIEGTAWSGEGDIVSVELSTDGGDSWHQATLGEGTGNGLARRFSHPWTPTAGVHRLLARATDGAGKRQPREPVWNELGYGNNLVHEVRVTAR